MAELPMAQTSRSSAPRRLPLLLAVTALALNLGLLVLYYIPTPKQLVGDETYYLGLATAIATGQPVRHDPLWPPLYGEAMGLLFSAVGVQILAVQLVQVGLWLATGYFLFRMTAQLVGRAPVATVALALYLFSPELMAFSHYLWPETLHLFLVMGGLWLLVCRGSRRWAAVAAGVLFGLALLAKSLFLAALPIVLLFVLLIRVDGNRLAGRAFQAALVAVACLVTVGVMLLAGVPGRGEPSIAGSGVFNAWVGLDDRAPADYQDSRVGQQYRRFVDSGPTQAARNAVYRDKIAAFVDEQGVAQILAHQIGKQYFRLFDANTFFTTQLPGGPRAAYSFQAPLLATFLRVYAAVFQGILLLAGAIGMASLRGRPVSWLHFFLTFILLALAVFLVLHVTSRYAVQLLPMWIVFAAAALYTGGVWQRTHQLPVLAGFVASRARLGVGIAWGLLLLFLAFRNLLA
jgi:hypothetical protein